MNLLDAISSGKQVFYNNTLPLWRFPVKAIISPKDPLSMLFIPN